MKFSHIDHIVTFVSDLENSKGFYSRIFGFPDHEDDESAVFTIGKTKLFIAKPYLHDKVRFDKDRVGVNHIALYIDHEKFGELVALLDKGGIIHSNIEQDPYSGNDFVWLDDPDGMRIEFYSRNVS